MEENNEIDAAEKFLNRKDLSAFKIVYQHYYKSLCFFAHGYLKEDTLVEDVVQDVFTQVWENVPQLKDATKLQSYLYMMVRNRCLNHKRNLGHFEKYSEQELQLEDWETDESMRLIKAEIIREIMDSLEKLPERAKEVFKLSYLTQLREPEVADRLGISVNSVKTHKKRAKDLLKKELKHIFQLILILNL